MKNLYVRFILIVACLFGCSAAFAQDASMDKLKKFFSNIAAYHNLYTQEKVYLHLDNNGYFPGENIWFKAYVVGAGSMLPTDMSKVLYVELVTPEGEVWSRKKYPILNGRTCGEFSLKDIVHTGFYEVRAYTRAMLNWDEACIFSRVIPVFDSPSDSLEYGPLTMYTPRDEKDKAFRRPQASPLKETTTQTESKTLLTFYPEGGHITKGLSSRMAFKVMDKSGEPLSTTVKLFDSNNTEKASASTIHEGMGIITVPADWSGGYAEVMNSNNKSVRFNVPEAREAGCDVSTDIDENGDLLITAKSNSAFNTQILGVSVTCRGMACYFDTLHISPSAMQVKKVPYKQLRDGIQQVTLFTDQGEILSERLVWVKPHKAPMKFSVAQNAEKYGAFSPVVLDFTLTDAQDKPLQGEFSLAVHDVSGELAADGTDINTELLLSSDLKGYIHQPEYYFASNDQEHQQALDLLLMVQGWRRYEWKEMSGVKPFVLKQPVEDGLLVDGKVVDNSSKHNAKEGIDVNLMIMMGGTFVSGSTQSAADGSFALLAPKFYGDGMGYFTTTVNDKRKSCNVALNRGFSPDPVAYNPLELKIDLPEYKEKISKLEPELFQWTDTLPRIIHIGEVKVTDKMLLHPFGSRYSWMGGEAEGKRYASMYYNIEDALEKLKDKGEREMNLWDWLTKVNPNFWYEPATLTPQSSNNTTTNKGENVVEPTLSTDEYPETIDNLAKLNNPTLYYKGNPIVVLLDNDLPLHSKVSEGDIDFLMSDVRSLIISENPDVCQRFGLTASINGRQRVTFFLYTRLDGTLAQYKKGQRITVLHGYSKYEEFYSPNYRTMDSPSASDVRRTLYWNPNVLTDKNGKANVLFFSNSRKEQRIRVNAQGIAVTGQMFSTK